MEPNTKVVYEKLAFKMLTGASNYEKWKRDVKDSVTSRDWGVASGQVKSSQEGQRRAMQLDGES